MDAFYHCIKAALNECQKTGLTLTKDICEVKVDNSIIDINFDLPVNRVAFLYKFGTLNIHIFKKCFLDFATNYHEISVVFERMLSSKLVCSLSNGPGTDIIGLQLALQELRKTFNPNTFFKIISKYGSWRNTMNSLIESKASAIPIIGSFKLLQCNVMESLSSKAENCLKSADIVLMDHTFASPNAQKVKILDTLKILLQIIKPGAYIFLIDTKTKVSYFQLLNSFGKYIYGPKEIQVDDLPYNEIVAKEVGEEPVRFGKAYFGVWQKTITANNIMGDGVSIVNVISTVGNSDKDIQRCIENVPPASNPMKVQLENKTIDHASVVNVVPATQNWGKSASSKSNSPQLQTPNVNSIPVMQRQNNSCKYNISSQLRISTENLSASVLLPKSCDESERKNANYSSTPKANSIASQQNVTNTETDCTENFNTLLYSLNSLVSKLENYLSSEIPLRNTGFLKYDEHRPTCHNQCFYHYPCCHNKRSCSQYCGHGPS